MRTSRTPTAPRAGASVRVRLSNLFDELDARKGKLLKSRIRCVSVDAVADSEPVWSVIPRRVRQLGLRMHRAWNGWQVPGVKFKLLNRTTSEGALVGGRRVLIGRTVLMGTDLVVDVPRARVIPNPKHPDGPVFRV